MIDETSTLPVAVDAPAVFHEGSNLLKTGSEPSTWRAHIFVAFATMTSDVLEPVVAHCSSASIRPCPLRGSSTQSLGNGN
jgi:hypothetical protein